jgi:hypothetical protein
VTSTLDWIQGSNFDDHQKAKAPPWDLPPPSTIHIPKYCPQSHKQNHSFEMSGLPFDQVSFLFLCIKNSTGKIDWNAVGKEYEMVHDQPLSGSAASKRFGRLKVKMDLQEQEKKGKKVEMKETPKKRGLKKEFQDESPINGKKVKTDPEVKNEEEDCISRHH